ncbi:hypothetical protein SH661x_002192 [Planctomicrobium sp. SH661]|uniref:hypothetical protein n=1 Tax=Planctomicrobium sp. SH661 TaxID=3448124 RepID=UPI003F5C8D4E
MNVYESLADDFFINMALNTELPLPSQRETVLDFFGRLQKAYPTLQNFQSREGSEFILEEDKEQDSYRWVSLEPKRVGGGVVNPRSVDDAMEQHRLILELAPYMLSVSPLDCEALDLMFGFDFEYRGNQDEIVAEALGLGPAFESLLSIDGARALNVEPSLTMLLTDDCRRQCRVMVETRTHASQIRRNDFPEDVISVYFTMRQYRNLMVEGSFQETLHELRTQGEDLLHRHVVDQILKPLAQAIAGKS